MKSVRVSSKSALHVTPGAASGVAVPKALQAPGLQQVQNSSERDPCLSMPGKNPLVSSGSLQPQLGQLIRAGGSSQPPGRQGLPHAFWGCVGDGPDLGTGRKSEVNAARHRTGPTHLLACHFKFNFLCLLFNLMYSFDLSFSPFSCLPEFADTVEAWQAQTS